jgi:hypothetical protein
MTVNALPQLDDALAQMRAGQFMGKIVITL